MPENTILWPHEQQKNWSATPVNLFRRVFNHYFDAGLPLRPDRHFVSQFGQPYRFIEVDQNGARLEAAAD